MIFNERHTFYTSHFWFKVGKLILGYAVITYLKCTASRSLWVCVVGTHAWLTVCTHVYWTHGHILLRKTQRTIGSPGRNRYSP